MRGPSLLAEAAAAAWLLAGVVSGLRDASRPPSSELVDGLLAKLGNLSRGEVGEALIPALQPPDGFVYTFANREGFPIMGSGWCGGFTWTLQNITEMDGGRVWEVNRPVAKMAMKCNAEFGHRSVHVFNGAGAEIFKIRQTHHRFNPLKKIWSFRILPPGSKNNDDALFTMNKDFWGSMGRDVWRVYRGKKKHDEMLYYGVSSLKAWKFDFCQSEDACEKGNREVLGRMTSNLKLFGHINLGHMPDHWKLEVRAGADPALLLAVTTVISVTREADDDKWDLVLLEKNASVSAHPQPSDGQAGRED